MLKTSKASNYKTTMASPGSIAIAVRASPHLRCPRKRKELVVTVYQHETILDFCHFMCSLIGCSLSESWVFHRGKSIVDQFGLTWGDIPCLVNHRMVELCIRKHRPQRLSELCAAELEFERRKVYLGLREIVQNRYVTRVLLPLAAAERKYVEICGLLCLIDQQEETVPAALRNALQCYMREVNRVSSLPHAWLQKEVYRIVDGVRSRRIRHLQRSQKRSLMR